MPRHTKELAWALIKWKTTRGSVRRRFKWEYLAEGAYREAYIGEDGLVYKVPVDLDEDTVSENESERKNYVRIRQMQPFEWKGNKWVLPSRMSLFKFPVLGDYKGRDGYYNPSVIVAPKIDGEPFDYCMDGCGADEWYECEEYSKANYYYSMFDLGCQNVLVQSTGARVMIDLQC